MKLLLEKFGFNNCEYVENGCCGMAGSFGYFKDKYDISIALAERDLIPRIKKSKGEIAVVAAGVSCREQINHGTDAQAKHPVEIIAEII